MYYKICHKLSLHKAYKNLNFILFMVNARFSSIFGIAGSVEPNISTPHKKPKNKELTEEQNEENKIFSGNRVFVEHIIRMVKIFRISEQRFRLRFSNYGRVMSVICGLVSLRIEAFVL